EGDEGPGPDHRGQADHDRVSQAEPSFERSRGGGHGAPFGGACTGAPTAPAAGAPRMPVRRGQPPSPDRTSSVPWARPWPLSWPGPLPGCSHSLAPSSPSSPPPPSGKAPSIPTMIGSWSEEPKGPGEEDMEGAVRAAGRRSALRHAVAQSQGAGTGEGDHAEGREQRSEAHPGAREVGAVGAVGRGVLGGAVVDRGDDGAVVLSGVIALVVAVARRGGVPVARGRGGGVAPVLAVTVAAVVAVTR